MYSTFGDIFRAWGTIAALNYATAVMSWYFTSQDFKKGTNVNISLLIRQKGRSQNSNLVPSGSFRYRRIRRACQNWFRKKESRPNFPKTNLSYPLIRVHVQTCVCVSGGEKYSFFGKFGVLCFLLTTVLRFVLLSYSRQYSKLYQHL